MSATTQQKPQPVGTQTGVTPCRELDLIGLIKEAFDRRIAAAPEADAARGAYALVSAYLECLPYRGEFHPDEVNEMFLQAFRRMCDANGTRLQQWSNLTDVNLFYPERAADPELATTIRNLLI